MTSTDTALMIGAFLGAFGLGYSGSFLILTFKRILEKIS